MHVGFRTFRISIERIHRNRAGCLLDVSIELEFSTTKKEIKTVLLILLNIKNRFIKNILH